MSFDKEFYNRASSEKLGWDPKWFGVTENDDRLIEAVKKWQRARSLKSDGLVGPMTFRRVWTEREAQISSARGAPGHGYESTPLVCHEPTIVHNGTHYPIKWPRVVLWDEPDGLKTPPGNYSSYAGKEPRKISHFVNHWDVCISSESCASILAKKGISVHFCIDNDGTIYQLLDTQHAAWHAGGRLWNHTGIGVEIANAYYLKYQDWYVSRGFGPRPIQEQGQVHGKTLKPFLDFYPVQLEALKALWAAVSEVHNIPLECPTDNRGKLVTTIDNRCVRGEFSGFVNHYNLTKRKIDCAGLDLVGLLDQAKDL